MKEFGSCFRLYFYSFLVYTNQGLLLVNTGPPVDLSRRNRFLREWAGSDRCKFTVSNGEKIEQALNRVGVSPNEVSHVIITPFQDYSIGRLNLFKNATIYLSRRGWFEDVVTPRKDSAFLSREIYFPKEIRRYIFEDAWDRIVLVENQNIVDGVSVMWTGGHHRSSMAVLLETMTRGTVGITDCAFTRRNLEENIPIGIAEDIHECLDSYSWLKNRSTEIIPAYDPENLERFKEFVA